MCFIYDLTEYVVAWVTPAKGNVQFAESLACVNEQACFVIVFVMFRDLFIY